MRGVLLLVFGLSFALGARPALALEPVEDMGFALLVEGSRPAAAALRVVVDRRLFSLVHGVARLGFEVPAAVVAGGGVLVLLDVFSWVPEWYVGAAAGLRDGRLRARLATHIGVRRFISIDCSLGLSLGYVYRGDHRLALGATLRWGE